MEDYVRTVAFEQGRLLLIDQRLLPRKEEIFICETYQDAAFAIREMVVRGAPAIGAAAGYGYYLAAKELSDEENREKFFENLHAAAAVLDGARPTAVNLRWALHRMDAAARKHRNLPMHELLEVLLKEADCIKHEDIETNLKLSKIGAELIPQNGRVLTHCNTGTLAAAGWGTALGVIKEAFRQGKLKHVYADETRPRLQGARLTAWELVKAGIPATLIPDSAAAVLLAGGEIDCVILGADRVAANGDVCNKIGTFMLAVLCKEFGIPFYSALPLSTIDIQSPTGRAIPIEQRHRDEVLRIEGHLIAPEEINVYNPAFDVTPHEYVTGIITESGVLSPPYEKSIKEHVASKERDAGSCC